MEEKTIPLSAIAPLLGLARAMIGGRRHEIDPVLVIAYDQAAEAAGYPLARQILKGELDTYARA
jgi:hypothetical protein